MIFFNKEQGDNKDISNLSKITPVILEQYALPCILYSCLLFSFIEIVQL